MCFVALSMQGHSTEAQASKDAYSFSVCMCVLLGGEPATYLQMGMLSHSMTVLCCQDQATISIPLLEPGPNCCHTECELCLLDAAATVGWLCKCSTPAQTAQGKPYHV